MKAKRMLKNNFPHCGKKFSTLWKMCVVVVVAGVAGVGVARGEAVRSDLNAWGAEPRMEQDATAPGIWTVTMEGREDRLCRFKFTMDQEWNNDKQYGLGDNAAAIPNRTPGVVYPGHYRQESWVPNDVVFQETPGRFYTFRLAGHYGDARREYVIMETDRAPVSIERVTHNANAIGGNAAVTVRAELSGTPGPQERVYLRYTQDEYASMAIVEMGEEGGEWTAAIPGSRSGTVNYFYVFSSTMPVDEIRKNPDLCTLRIQNNDGRNFGFVSGVGRDMAQAFMPGDCWHEPREALQGLPSTTIPMRSPYEPEVTRPLHIYVGNFQLHDGGANMTDGTVWYRSDGAASWQSAEMEFHNLTPSWDNVGLVKNWGVALPATEDDQVGGELAYVIQVGYDNRDTTFLGTTNQLDSIRYSSLTDAKEHAFQFAFKARENHFGDSWHRPNRHLLGMDMQIPMRNPVAPVVGDVVYLYVGNYISPSTGGALTTATAWHRQNDGEWESAHMWFDSLSSVKSGVVENYIVDLPTETYAAGDTLEYVFQLEYADRDPTFLALDASGNPEKYPSLKEAKLSPYAIGFLPGPAQ